MTEKELKKKTEKAYRDNLNPEAKESTEKMIEIEDEYAEKPEEVLNETELKELKEMEKDKRKPFSRDKKEFSNEAWVPRTKLGLEVKEGKIKDIDEIINKKLKVLEPEIIDKLLPIESDLISIGQSKGKFGGGKRRGWR
jgi:hypothetical protein